MIREEKSHIPEVSQKVVSESTRKTPFNKAIETNPRLAAAYYDRANAYYNKGEYEKVWEDINRAQSLGFRIPKRFLKALRKVSGRAE